MGDTDEKTPPPGAGGGETSSFDHLRSQIKQSISDLQARQKTEQFQRRIEIARAGIASYESKRFSEAIQLFNQYLKILGDWKGVKAEDLSPRHFEAKEEQNEKLLITGIFWDLAKLYDRTKNPKNVPRLKQYLGKYVDFSKGADYQALCSETIRKYVVANKPLHKAEFNAALASLMDQKCFVITALADGLTSDEVLPFYRFRDEVLSRSRMGRGVIGVYYRVGPLFARVLNRSPSSVKTAARKLVRFFAKII